MSLGERGTLEYFALRGHASATPSLRLEKGVAIAQDSTTIDSSIYATLNSSLILQVLMLHSRDYVDPIIVA